VTTVGVIANPASGRDVRRLVSGASVFDNAEKGAMVHRLMVGLAAAGVERVLMMPAGSGLSESLRRTMRAHRELARPELEILEMRLSGTADDTATAVLALREAGVAAIAVLGGDGTHRIVARHCGDIPLCALSTGTNNAFPEVREATIAGIATGLVATGRVDEGSALRREKLVRIGVNGESDRDCALVDVARTTETWVGARALWRPADVAEVVIAFGEPGSVGLSSLAGLIDPISHSEPCGLYLRLAPVGDARLVIKAPLVPGLVTEVGIAEHRRVEFGELIVLEQANGSLAVDGEREIELSTGDRVEVTVSADGPLVIDVRAAMAHASRLGLLVTGRG
jgi:predicted polyphosphate/ATP-dependent NAD kinase